MTLDFNYKTKLRPYQIEALDMTIDFLAETKGRRPCIVLPTGSGKSWICAGFVEYATVRYTQGRVVVVTHTKELVKQDYDKFVQLCPEADVGIFCSSLGRKDVGCRVTFASIGSIHRHPELFEGVGLLIVDEAHRIDATGKSAMYYEFIKELRKSVPNLILIGLTATPFRMGQGLLTEGDDALFDDILEGVGIERLIEEGFLADIVSKASDMKLEGLENVHLVKGDYNKDELSSFMDVDEKNSYIADWTINAMDTNNCQHGLFFCCSVAHAQHLAEYLQKYGVENTRSVYGNMPQAQRDQILNDFKSGKLRILTSVDMLTTGFDYPDIDFIALCRPTKSANLYVQMVGRGMRPKSQGVNQKCIVMDFGECAKRFGPITKLYEEAFKRHHGDGEAPIKQCPQCNKLIPAALGVCPFCHFKFPLGDRQGSAPKEFDKDADIIGKDQQGAFPKGKEIHQLRGWVWSAVLSNKKVPQICIRLRIDDKDVKLKRTISYYLAVNNDNIFTRLKARNVLQELLIKLNSPFVNRISRMKLDTLDELKEVCAHAQTLIQPKVIEATYSGRNNMPTRIRILG